MATRNLIIGCGYLGRRVGRRWLAQGDSVFALTRSTDRARDLGNSGFAPVIGDVTAPSTFAELPEVETLLYAVGLDRSSGKSQRDVYVDGLDNVLSRIAGKVRRFLYVSSTSVYGQTAGEWVDETSECRPESESGKVCLDAEMLLRGKVPNANVLRLAGIYGPGRLVARIAELRAGQILEGNPEAWLNLIHVDDAVASILACEERGQPGSTYLVCDDQPSRRMEYYSLFAALIGAPAPTYVLPPLARGGQGGTGGASSASDETRRQGEGETRRTAPGSGSIPEIHDAADQAKESREVVNPTIDTQSQLANLNKRCRNRRLHDELQVTLHYPNMHIGLPMALTTRADFH